LRFLDKLGMTNIGYFNSLLAVPPGFPASGLKAASVIRLGFLTTLPARRLLGIVGSISRERHQRLLQRLFDYPQPNEVA